MKESRMKEIGKLIELLNEYEDGMVSLVKEYVEEFGVFVLNTEQMIEEEIIISKSFGFVKRLVEKDKIDRHNVGYSTMLGQLSDYHGLDGEQELLMILAIQEKPIEFLVSILK